jgi:hypothetical protein
MIDPAARIACSQVASRAEAAVSHAVPARTTRASACAGASVFYAHKHDYRFRGKREVPRSCCASIFRDIPFPATGCRLSSQPYRRLHLAVNKYFKCFYF